MLKHELLTALEKKKEISKEIEDIREQLREVYKDNMSKKQISSAKRLTEIRKSDVDLVRKLKLEKKSKAEVKKALELAKAKRKE